MRTRRFVPAALAATVAGALASTIPASPAHAATATFAASADTYVQQSTPTTAYGTANRIVVDNSPVRRMFLKFVVSGLAGPVTGARLRVHTISGNAGSNTGGTVRSMTGTTWSESAVTWNSQPAIDGATLGSVGRVSPSTWYEIDVTAAVTGNGTYSFGATSTSTDGAYYDSRETGANGPQLVVTTATGTGDPVLVGAGDIARCGSTGDDATADLLDGIPGTVFTAGDNSQDSGTPSQFSDCYDPSWGRHKARTRPAPGNHDYGTAGASGYFGYFGAAAGEPGKGYYSYDLGDWHIVALNSNCSQVGGCGAGSAQEQWLRADLAASTRQCTAAYWHHPLFTSGAAHAPATEVRPLFQALYDHDAEIVLNGHNHIYERFAPQNPTGGLDNTRGIRAFEVGTGGTSHYAFGTIAPNSEVRNNTAFGVLKLTLRSGGYDWQFIPVAGQTFTDSGSGTCH